jgi:hypothetical protein
MTDPYAAYGGGTPVQQSAPPPPAQAPAADPYAAYGGGAPVQTSAPLDDNGGHPTSGWASLLGHKVHIDPNDGGVLNTVKRVLSVGAGIGDAALDTVQGTENLLHTNPDDSTATKVLKYAVSPTLNMLPDPRARIASRQQDLQTDNSENPGLNTTGKVLETVAEFMTGEEVLKGLSGAQKLAKVAPVLATLEKFPKTARVLAAAIRQGTVGATQAKLKGATTSDALESGAITGGIGGAAELAIPALYSGAKNLIEKIRPGTTTLFGGETIPVLASQMPGADAAATRAATTANAPEVAAAQQGGGMRSIQNVAQRAASDSLDRVNALRRTAPPITDASRMLPAPAEPFQFHIDGPPTTEATEGETTPLARKRQIGTNVVAGKGSAAGTPVFTDQNISAFTFPTVGDEAPLPEVSDLGNQPDGNHREPVWQFLTGTKPGAGEAGHDVIAGGGQLVTSDPAAAQSALSRLEELAGSDKNPPSDVFKSLPAEQQAHIVEARNSLQDQLGMYHGVNTLGSHFEPVDVAGALQHVTNFGEAADQIQAAVKPIYQKLDEVSGGQFTALRNQAKAASKVMFQPGSVDAYEKALDSKQAAEQGIQDLFNRHSGDVNRVELQTANSAWRDSVVLDNLHSTVEGAIKGAPQNIADSLGTNRLIRGNSLTTRLNKLLQSTPQADVERVIGRDGLENLYRVGDLLSKPETAIPTQNVAKEIARELVKRVGRGAFIGGLLGHVVGHSYEGALLGAGAEDATRYVLRQAAINPRVGVMVDRAVRHQVSPRIFAPLIAGEIDQPAPQSQEVTQ